MGKRKTAKTGDKALYGSREQLGNQLGSKRSGRHGHGHGHGQDHEGERKRRTKTGENPIYGEVDRFHNEKDYDVLRLDRETRGQTNSEDEDLAGTTRSVLDLAAGETTSEEEDGDNDGDDSLSSSDGSGGWHNDQGGTDPYWSSEEDDSVSSSNRSIDEGDSEPASKDDPRNWGKRKSLYYHGDTADLEIGQEEEDAYLEEEAAQEIQASRFEEMDDYDFVLSENDNEDGNDGAESKNEMTTTKKQHEEPTTIRYVSRLSKKETRKLLEQQFPELLPMVTYFSNIVEDVKVRTKVGVTALLDGEGTAESVGATIKGQQYLLTKAMVQKSLALNSVVYILLRLALVGDEDATTNIRAHPIMDQLKKFTSLLGRLEEDVQRKTSDIALQLDNLIEAAALVEYLGGNDGVGSAVRGTCDGSETNAKRNDDRNLEQPKRGAIDDGDELSNGRSDGGDGDDFEEEKRAAVARQKQKDFERTLNEARFGLRPNEANTSGRASRKTICMPMVDDFGDLERDHATSNSHLASAVNTIEQRSRKRRPAPVMAEDLDDIDEYDDRVVHGIKMMEEELGKLDQNGDYERMDDAETSDGQDPDAGEPGFYDRIAAQSQERKFLRTSLYGVVPKFPRVDGEVVGERSIGRVILKNRGLVAHKAKINRNPRVKKREQYRRALIRRKGAVREVREAGEGNRYGGEQTGIKSRISRSRKL